MRKKAFRLLLLYLTIPLCAPALAATHKVEIRAKLELEEVLLPGSSIAVYSGPETDRGGVVHQEMGDEIERFLEEGGYVPTAVVDADFHVLFAFGTQSMEPSLAEYRADRGRRIHGDHRYEHYFEVAVTDAVVFRESGETRVVWRGMAILADRATKDPGGESEERALAVLRVLRQAALEFFGQTQDAMNAYYPELKGQAK